MVTINSIVDACIDLYNKIKKGKPTCNEWTVISAVVGVFNDQDIRVLSLGTGSKCIGKSAMSMHGNILNDSHAEVIARRAFLKYLYYEIISYNQTQTSLVLHKENIFFKIKESVKFYFVTSMSPCGDASIIPKLELSSEDSEHFGTCLKSEQFEVSLKRKSQTQNFKVKKLKTEKKEMDIALNKSGKIDDIYRTGAKCLPNSSIQDSHCPGILYHNIGAVRTKPGRGDPTLSLSCSDKIARWISVGWQGALLSLLIQQPIVMEGIICGGGCPFSNESFNRAVNGRTNQKKCVPIYQSDIQFPHIKKDEKKPSSLSIIWSRSSVNELEVSVKGYRQGVTKKCIDKKKARTSICKKELFFLFELVLKLFPDIKYYITNLLKLEEKSFKEVEYGVLKKAAKDYQNKWDIVKNNCLKIWSQKPADLLKFTLKEE